MADRDASIHEDITQLVEREQELRSSPPPATPEERQARGAELKSIEEKLDVCWDLLRQRQARREFDQDESEAAARPATVVENYRQ